MTDKETMIKAISIAIDRGWELCTNDWEWKVEDHYGGTLRISTQPDFKKIGGIPAYIPGDYSAIDIIFNHDFAKALWGDTTQYLPSEHAIGLIDPTHDVVAADGYKYHLQQMATIATYKGRIAYLREHLDDR